MVKREMVVPHTVVQVSKVSPGPAGPNFTGKFAVHEKLEVVAPPFSRGGMNLVRVRRVKTGAEIELLYAFITNYCRLSKGDTPPDGTD